MDGTKGMLSVLSRPAPVRATQVQPILTGHPAPPSLPGGRRAATILPPGSAHCRAPALASWGAERRPPLRPP
eukprot:5037879-Alexandrium_andersonii.AAC.1